MKTTLIIICFLSFFNFIHAQEMNEEMPAVARNSVFLELGGNGGTFSLNYDRLLHRGKWFHTSARIGIAGYWWNGGGIGLPLEFNTLIGTHKHFLEVGTGLMVSHGYESIIYNKDPSNPEYQFGYKKPLQNQALLLLSSFFVTFEVGLALKGTFFGTFGL